MRKFLLIVILLQGCASNLYLGTKSEDSRHWPPVTVAVTNPDHPNFEILKRSGIFEISESEETINKVTLLDSEIMFSCGNGLIPPMFTLGILPGYMSEGERFMYTVESDGAKQTEEYYLDMYSRHSIWEWLIKPFRPSDIEIAARALSVAKHAKENGFRQQSGPRL